jgi:hypothetical protein
MRRKREEERLKGGCEKRCLIMEEDVECRRRVNENVGIVKSLGGVLEK